MSQQKDGYTGMNPGGRILLSLLMLHPYMDIFKVSNISPSTATKSVLCLHPPQSIRDEVHAKWGSLNKDAVVVHIRQGDYTYPVHAHHGILNYIYFLRAMRLASNSTFVIFSDDIAWCKQQEWLKRPDCIFVDEPNETNALYLMSLFSSFILSNSSIS